MSRSFLFVPADSERKLAKADEVKADALILDLEDSVQPAERPAARRLASEFLQQDHAAELWVRINAIDSPDAMPDLAAVVCASLAGVVLPKPASANDAIRLGEVLDTLELEGGLSPGLIGILPVATERPEALFRLHEYADATGRLRGLTWGAEDLSAAVGATRNREDDGSWLPPYELARSLCLFAAAAAEVPAIDTVFTDYRDDQGLARYAAEARRDGFSGMLAIHPDQVDVINAAFVPGEDEISRAQRIVELFDANPEAGTVGMDGEMIDRPHLLQAKRILDMAGH